ELPAGAFHLVVRATDGVTAADIAEPRRDVRREPYRDAYARHRHSWTTRAYVRPGLDLRTLVVPLVGMNQLLGMWLVNFARDAAPSTTTLERIDRLAAHAGATLLRLRLGEGAVPGVDLDA